MAVTGRQGPTCGGTGGRGSKIGPSREYGVCPECGGYQRVTSDTGKVRPHGPSNSTRGGR